MLILYSDDVNGEKRKAKFFAVLYVAVPTFDTIGLKGKFSVVSFFLCVWSFAVSQNKLGLHDFEYIRL